MQTSAKLIPGQIFPTFSLTSLNGETITCGKATKEGYWQAIFVYRGKHCPLCTKYLNNIEGYLPAFDELKIEVVAVSGDSLAQATAHSEALNVSFPIGYGLSLETMQALGLFISTPRSEQETDHPFAEPGLFIVNDKGALAMVDLANVPFIRPELESLVMGLKFVKNPDNNYPIRGTFQPNQS